MLHQEAYNEEHYSAVGLAHVKDVSFKAVILRHYPELKESIGNVQSAFSPWEGKLKYGGKGSLYKPSSPGGEDGEL